MDPNRQPPLFPHAHSYDLDFDIHEQHTNDPNVWSGYATTPTSLPPTTQDPNAAWTRNQLSLLPQYLGDVNHAPHQQHHLHQQYEQQRQQQQQQPQHQHYPQQHRPRNHPQQQHHHLHHHYYQPPFSSPPPAAFNPALHDSYLLTQPAPSPYAYHGSPTPYHITSPVSGSMSVSAISSVDPVPPQQTQPLASNTFLPTPKQIRFVSSDGQPHAKRRRINAACLTCRKRKTRCSGERPECKTCTDNGHTCAGYAERPSRKDSEKRSDDGDDDEDGSGSSSPKKHVSDYGQGASKPPPVASQPVVKSERYDGRYQQAWQEPTFDNRSPSNYTAGTSGSSSTVAGRTRVPYFRYFGPTAIVPGFKQMVVQMKNENRRSHTSASGDSPRIGIGAQGEAAPVLGNDISPALVDLPYYDATDLQPIPTLIKHLCETFFNNLGCNYPFLQKRHFLKDLGEKRVDAILVNAVCALAARFSSDPVLKRSDLSLPLDSAGDVKRAFRGQPFAQRAMAAVIDTFPCPTLAVTQACLLLAYEEFGSDKDSGLWMYLGTSIRMAQDLGIQKLEGMHFEGRIGPTPKTAKNGREGKQEERRRVELQKKISSSNGEKNGSLEDRRSSERERIDTFWGVFFLDRAVSSGVGRPVTLRDKDIEISFPYRPDEKVIHGHPHPFPAMIRIVHMYGRVADVLNSIKEITQVNEDVLQRLAEMERNLTGIYQRLSPKLHFNATNFQHYVKHGQGTNFILLHFWFHTLIVLVHQPTLLHSFQGSIQQLFPDSRELSMSSAKTIADILAFAELIDINSLIGNPFTSQPMYVAACAFLAESAAHSSSPPTRDSTYGKQNRWSQAATEAEQKWTAKHSSSATAAYQNYQRCYKALKMLHTYWAGCRYILTALDQKSKGLMDPLLFTSDDVDGEMPSTEPSFTTPGWRRSSYGVSLGGPHLDRVKAMCNTSQETLWSPKMDWSHAIGWSLTGTGNSPGPNLSFLYQNPANENDGLISTTTKHVTQQTQASVSRETTSANEYPALQTPNFSPQPFMLPPRARLPGLAYDSVATADGELLLGLHSPYSVGSGGTPTVTSGPQHSALPTFEYSQPHAMQAPTSSRFFQPTSMNYGDMMIETQEIDISDQNNFHPFAYAGDMLPWLEYLPRDVLNYFGDAHDMGMTMHGHTPAAGMVMPSGPGPPDTGRSRDSTPR